MSDDPETPSEAGFLFPPRVMDAEANTLTHIAYPELVRTICGTVDDSQPVEQYNGALGVTVDFVAANQRSVGQVQWNANLASLYTKPGNVSGVRWGSGTMISADLFLTAGHLFDQTGGGWTRPQQNGTTTTISPQEIAANMHVNFNYQVDPAGNPRPEQSFAIQQLIEYRVGNVDFAVILLAGSPGRIFGFTQVASTNATAGDMVAILGHPAGVPKRIEAGPVTQITATQILYNDIDTLGGNSGSGILRSPGGAIVGVHTDGGCTSTGGANFGAPIAAIIANSPAVRGTLADQAVVAWKGMGTDERLFYNTSSDGQLFTHQRVIPGTGGTSHSPALAALGEKLFLVWKGIGADQRLFVSSSTDGLTFTDQRVVPGVGGSSNAPAIAASRDRLFLAWKGMGADERLFYNSTADGRSFTGQRQIPGTGGSSAGPALATSSTRLYVAWKGMNADQRLFFCSSGDGVNFTPQQTIPGTGGSSHAPALATSATRLYVAWKGMGADPRLFISSTGDGVTFTPQRVIPGTGGSSHSPAIAAYNNRLYVVWKGIGDDSRLFFTSSGDGVNFADQRVISGTGGTSDAPRIASLRNPVGTRAAAPWTETTTVAD